MASKRSTKGAHYCVAIGGSHNTKTHKDKFHFYRFPAPKSHSVQKDLWICAVSLMYPDGSDWEPKSHHVLCSAHFISGKKSYDPLNPDFSPTIFGTNHIKKATISNLNRFKRWSLRSALPKNPYTKEQSCQTDVAEELAGLCPYYVHREGPRDVGLQSFIPLKAHASTATSILKPPRKKAVKSTESKLKFRQRLRHEREWQAWTGISEKSFKARNILFDYCSIHYISCFKL